MPVRFARHKGIGSCLIFSSFKSQQSDITLADPGGGGGGGGGGSGGSNPPLEK